MSLDDLGLVDYESKTLIIDGDIVIYQPCCIFNEDDDADRNQIIKYINKKIEKLMMLADCDKYIMFVTTKTNFRDDLVEDYKANRADVERPVNLIWAKRWCLENLNNHYHKKLEADDLLGIHMSDSTVLWSLDKDLRQIPGKYLDDATGEVIEVTHEGILRVDKITSKTTGKTKDKVYFDGTIGFYYQLLIGDSTDHIVGCGRRERAVYKSGAKKGQEYIVRKGVGSGAALKILYNAHLYAGGRPVLDVALEAVIAEYKKVFGEDWQENLETQANLLYMVREQHGEIIKRWTYDGRDEYFDLIKGVIIHDYTPE